MLDEIPLMPLSPLEDYEGLIPFPRNWDFVLVCDDHKMNSVEDRMKKKFLEELHKKGFIIKEIQDQKLFYGVHAPSGIFRKYQWLINNPDNELGHLLPEQLDYQESAITSTRIRIVSFILQNTEIPHTKEKLRDLIKKKVFETAFPLHERENLGRFLKMNWAQWRDLFCRQPIGEIRTYFGEKIALYYAWLGWYTCVLLIAAVPGCILFIYGFIRFSSGQISKEICEANTTIMCPLCDQNCPFWILSDTCTYAKITHVVDNECTVVFAIFMTIWATVFLEVWKRHRAKIVNHWNMYQWDEEEEELTLEIINNPESTSDEYQHSYLRSIIVLVLSLIMICVLIGIAHALVIYRVVVTVIFTQSNSKFLQEKATTVAVLTGAVLHYLSIVIMSKVNKYIAHILCELERPRSFSEREKSYTIKVFTFQFFTYFSSLIYVAFFLGRINGHPGSYVRVAGKWRLEECHPSGCITDLFIQMFVIMTLKQTLSTLMEYLRPCLTYKCHLLCRKPQRINVEQTSQDLCKEEWLWNYQLSEVNVFTLFDEYMEMMIQYSFTTIFVAAFPLAPFLAFVNNLFEIRLDAIKMVKLQKRMVPKKANTIGIWYYILETIGILSVIGNGLVIAITSDFIPMLVYQYTFSPCKQKNNTGIDCLTGYVNHSLSVFNIQHFENTVNLTDPLGNEITHCRYPDYRNSDDYNHSIEFWHIFAARVAFLFVFEHVALCVKLIAAWFVPDDPRSVKNDHLKEKRKKLKQKLRAMDDSTDI
ncbi:anoctamin-9 isoform X2 [Crotalus tigris]|uniref:anoctamin-9 isoform X2 n=1 Tax=Crotalus tigris TaxID=88082 RepID=UPI00192F209C|nr:anoctamin-9 isoform X2 [Crotalus tigris]